MTTYALIVVLLVASIAVGYAIRLHLQQRQLRRQLMDTAQMCDLANDAVLVGDIIQGRVLYANRAFERLLGYESHVLVARKIPELHPPEFVSRSAERIAEVWEKKGLIYADLPLIDQSGERIDVEISANLVTYAEQPAILMYARDIRERLRNERELSDTQAQLIQSEKLATLGKLASGVAHEMNSPIGTLRANTDVAERAIEIFTEAMKTAEPNPKMKRAIEALRGITGANRSAVQRVSEIVKSLQNFARLDEAERKRVDLHEGIRSALTLLNPELKDRITVELEFGDLPEIECSPGRLNQVYMNVLSNAIAAIEGSGTIRIRSRIDDDRAELSFSDTGRGIPRHLLGKLFDLSFQTKQGRMRAGLGLPASYRIVTEHGGSMSVESEEGRGTTIVIKLPLARASSSS